MIPGAANESRSRVTIRAVEVGINVCSMLTGCGITIVTRSTVVYDAAVIKSCWYKACGVVTYSTILICWNVIGRFAC